MSVSLLLVVLTWPVFIAVPIMEPNITLLAIEDNDQVKLLCLLDSFYPKELTEVKWLMDNNPFSGSAVTRTLETKGQKSFFQISEIHIEAQQLNEGTEYTCQATHNPENISLTWNKCRAHPLFTPLINLKKPRLVSAKTNSEQVTASCVVEAAANTRVSWVLNGNKQREASTHTAVDKPGSKTQLITSTLTLSAKEWEREQRLTCRVQQPCDEEHEETVNVLEPVEKTPTVEIRRPLSDVLKGVVAVLECSARDLPSGEFSVTFQANEHQIHEEYVKVPKSTLITHANIPTIYQRKDYSFTCKVQQSPSNNWESNSTGYIFDEPSVELLVVPNAGGTESQTLLCYGTGFSPKITWSPTSVQISSNTMMQADGRVTVSSEIRVPRQHYNKGEEYTCQVNDLGNPVKKSISVCAAKFSLKINPPSAKDIFVHNKAIITCVVTGDDKNEVDGAILSWTVGGQKHESSGTDNVKQTTPPFTKTSSLTLEQFEWFSGAEVKCSTERKKTPFSDKIKVKKGGKLSILFYKPEKDVRDTEMVSLLCEVSSSDLGDVYIMWKMNNGQYIEGSSTVHINEKTVLSYLTVSGKEYNSAQFACAVKDANMEWNFLHYAMSKVSHCPICPVLECR